MAAMTYHFSKILTGTSFEEAVARTTEALNAEGFGILSEVDIHVALKKKLDIDFRKYRILGACNPPLAYRALQHEDKIGTMLPCNVVVQELRDKEFEISAVDPVASMQAVNNPDLREVAELVRAKLRRVVESL
jgi:uncharacterized protein (DUF302 family)